MASPCAEHPNSYRWIGVVPGVFDFTPGSVQLAQLEKELQAARSALAMTEMTLTPAPIGVGFVTGGPSVTRFRETALPLLEKYSTSLRRAPRSLTPPV